MLKPVSLWCAGLVVLVHTVNFFWVVGANAKYGSALNGFMRNGHYYLSLHGSYTEVSRALWENIQLHEVVNFLVGPFAIACTVYLVLKGYYPWALEFRRGEAVIERVRAVRVSGGHACAGALYGHSCGRLPPVPGSRH